jgi:hypothetical protein
MQFSTNLNCANCVSAVGPTFDTDPRVHHWSVDTSDKRKVLTVEGAEITEAWVRSTVQQAGFKVLERLDSTLPISSAQPSSIHSNEPVPPARETFSLTRYKPLLLIVGYLLATVALVEWRLGGLVAERAMSHFMGGFFLMFSFFKLLDLAGFASAFAMYDVVARRVPLYAWAYPFIEIALGVAYLLMWTPPLVHWITLTIMLVGAIGVVNVLRRGATIRCACLGTVFNLPMSVVTVVENGLMAVMAIAMLLQH